MKLLILVLLSSVSVFGLEDSSQALPKSILELIISAILKNYFQELSHRDPFHVPYANSTYLNRTVELYNFSSAGFSNVQVSHVNTWGLFFSKHISLELTAPHLATSIDHFVVTGKNGSIHGSSSLELVNWNTWIYAKVNILSHQIKEFKASFHLQRANASIVAIRNGEDLGRNVTDNVNHYLNFRFNNDYKLHQKMSDYLRHLLENIW